MWRKKDKEEFTKLRSGKNSLPVTRISRFLKHQSELTYSVTPANSLELSHLRRVVINPNVQSHIPLAEYLPPTDLEVATPTMDPGLAPESGIVKDFGKIVDLSNVFLGEIMGSDDFAKLLDRKLVRKVMIVSDTIASRGLTAYINICATLDRLKIKFVEFTNVQPQLDRQLILSMADFAVHHEINSIIVVGSNSTLDVVKLAYPKIVKPGIVRIHRRRRAIIRSPHFSIISFPTTVVPDPMINSRSQLENKVLFKKINPFSDSIFLSSAINNCDGVFYCPSLFTDLGKDKQMQVLHEIFFRLILNSLDKNINTSIRKNIASWIGTIQRYSLFLNKPKNLLSQDQVEKLCRIHSRTMDGTTFLDMSYYWTWFKLESSLSAKFNCKKVDGLSLFFLPFFKFEAQNNSSFKTSLEELGKLLYGTYSVNGFLYRISKYMDQFSLPNSLYSIPEISINEIDFKLLNFLVKKSSPSIFSYKVTKSVIKDLSIW